MGTGSQRTAPVTSTRCCSSFANWYSARVRALHPRHLTSVPARYRSTNLDQDVSFSAPVSLPKFEPRIPQGFRFCKIVEILQNHSLASIRAVVGHKAC